MGQNLAPPAPQPIRADLAILVISTSGELDPPGRRARRSTSGAGLARGIVCLSRAHRGAGSYDSFTGRAAPRFYHGRPGPGTKAEPGDRGRGSTTVRVAGPVCAVIHRLCLPPEARRAILLTTLDTTPQRHLSRGAVDNRPSSQNTSFHLRLVDVSLARGSRSRGARLTSPKSATAASDTISATPLRVLS